MSNYHTVSEEVLVDVFKAGFGVGRCRIGPIRFRASWRKNQFVRAIC